MWGKAEVTKSQGMFLVVRKEETKSESSRLPEWMAKRYTRRATPLPLTGPPVLISTGARTAGEEGGDTYKRP